MPRTVSTRLWAWSTVGLAGAVLTALSAPRALHDHVVGWWYHPGFPGSDHLATTLVWVGMGVLALAWLAVAVHVRRGEITLGRRAATVIGLGWALPLALAPPLFSRDVYSYLAQGTILHLGDNPYHTAPAALAGLGHRHMLAAVSPFWRGTTAPYGPLFLEAISLIVGITHGHLIGGVLLCRVLDLIGLALVIIHVPRLTQALGTDPGPALWLMVASPLVLLGIVAPGHNDILMVGLLAAGLSTALRGNPLLGVCLCAVAATIKVPALVGAAFIIVCWARAERTRGAQLSFAAGGVAITVAVLGLITVASNVGVGWLSSAVFSTPAKVHLAITPATAVGYTAARLLGDLGASVSVHGLEAALGLVATGVAAVVGLSLLWRARIARLPWLLGVTLVLAAVLGPAAWPWYLTWGLVALAACPGVPASWPAITTLTIGGLLIKPDGNLILPGTSAPAVLAAYVVLALLATLLWRRRRRLPTPSAPTAALGSRPPVQVSR